MGDGTSTWNALPKYLNVDNARIGSHVGTFTQQTKFEVDHLYPVGASVAGTYLVARMRRTSNSSTMGTALRTIAVIDSTNTANWTSGVYGQRSIVQFDAGATGTVSMSANFIAANAVLNWSGTLTKQVGLYVEALTGATTNYAIETAGSTQSLFGGGVRMLSLGLGTDPPSDYGFDVLTGTSSGNRHLFTVNSGLRFQRKGDASGWSFIYGFRTNNEAINGGFGALGSNTAITYYYIGQSSSVNHWSIYTDNGRLEGTGASTITTSAGDLSLTTGTGGYINILPSGTNPVVFGSNSKDAHVWFRVSNTSSGSTSRYMQLDTTSGHYNFNSTWGSGNAGDVIFSRAGGARLTIEMSGAASSTYTIVHGRLRIGTAVNDGSATTALFHDGSGNVVSRALGTGAFVTISNYLLASTAASTYEPVFSKNTAFNKNFGTTGGTVAEGNDSRITNGQTAYGWGNHASLYPLLNGTGATGTWGISISGTSTVATNLENGGGRSASTGNQFLSIDSTNSFAYLSLRKNSVTIWDLAVDNTASNSNFQLRPGGSATNALTYSTAGMLTVVSVSRYGGTSAQFLKADGSADSNTYLTTSSAASIYEPVFGKNTAFNKNFGTTGGTVAEGNDSRITNGQTAYGWGNHASAGYLTTAAGILENAFDPYSTVTSKAFTVNAANSGFAPRSTSIWNLDNSGNSVAKWKFPFVNANGLLEVSGTPIEYNAGTGLMDVLNSKLKGKHHLAVGDYLNSPSNNSLLPTPNSGPLVPILLEENAVNIIGCSDLSSTESASGSRYLYVINSRFSGFNLTLKHASVSATSNQRFFLPGGVDKVLGPGESVMLMYFEANWHIVGSI